MFVSAAVRSLFRSGKKLDDSKALIVFSLFFFSNVEFLSD